MSRLGRVRATGDSGVYAILFAMLVVVILGTAAVVIDLATLRQSRGATRSAADSAVTAAAAKLNAQSPAASKPREACQAAWQYLRSSLSSLPDGSGNCSALPLTGTVCTTPIAATYDVSPWVVRITWPVPDKVGGLDNPLMTKPDSAPAAPPQPVNSVVDGAADGCARIAVEVFQTNKIGFGAVFGVGDVPTRAASVARSVPKGDVSEDIAALNILEPTECEALTTSGQGAINVNGFGLRAGIIAIESDGRGGNCNGQKAVIHPNDNALNYIHANGADGTVGGGLIESYAMNPNPVGEPTRAITNATRVSPAPTRLNSRSGKTPVTRLYDCTGSMVCLNGGGPYITNLKAAMGTGAAAPTTVPATLGAWKTLPGPSVPTFNCQQPPSDPIVIVPVGNYWIDCGSPQGLKVGGTVIFEGGRIVTRDSVSVGTDGCLAINVVSATCPTAIPGTPTTPASMTPGPNGAAALLYIGGTGTLSTGGQARLFMPQVFTFINNGKTDLAGGSGSALFMTTPLATGTPLVATACTTSDLACSYGVFHKLVLWSEGTATHNIGGQSAMGLRGVLFTPNAPSNLSGQATSAQQNAQFWTRTLDVGGQAAVHMAADPDAAIARPTYGVALLR